jgi:hypothetical protein
MMTAILNIWKEPINLDCEIKLELFLNDDFRSRHLNCFQSGVKLTRTYWSNRRDLGRVINNIYANYLLKALSYECVVSFRASAFSAQLRLCTTLSQLGEEKRFTVPSLLIRYVKSA